MSFIKELSLLPKLRIRQRFEALELLGFETRNKYLIEDLSGKQVAFAAEQQKGLGGFLFRQLLGHWRTFEIQIFDIKRELVLRAHHPFRWYFERLEVYDAAGRFLGALQRRFSILTKVFDVEGPTGNVALTVRSPIWKIWTFAFMRGEKEVAVVRKKWTGLLAEGFTDKDVFEVDFGELESNERPLLLAAGIFIDLRYFERKAAAK